MFVSGEMNMNINDRIRQRREELGLTLSDVADKLGVNKTTVLRYETKDIEKLPVQILKPLAKVLKTNELYLMGLTDDTSPLVGQGGILDDGIDSLGRDLKQIVVEYPQSVQEDIYAFGRAANEMTEEEREEMMNFLKRMYKEHF
jgi:DNA-binding helix-turn-helix protein